MTSNISLETTHPTMISNIRLETIDERYGVVLRIYIKTTKDNVVSLAKQELIALSLPEKVYSIESDHSSFFSTTEKLHSLLLGIANTYYVKHFQSSLSS